MQEKVEAVISFSPVNELQYLPTLVLLYMLQKIA